MSNNHHTPYAVGAELAATVMNAPLGQIDQTLTDMLAGAEEFSGLKVGAGALHASAAAQIDSTTKGFLPPRMTTAQRDAIATPATGLLIWNTTTNSLNYYDGAWQVVGTVGGAMTELIAPTALVASTGVSLTGISQSYLDLVLMLRIRSDAAAENDTLTLRFNNDSGASSYAWTQVYAAASANFVNDANDDAIDLRVPAASATAGRYLDIMLRIFNYLETADGISGYFDGVLADDVFYSTWGGFRWVGGSALNRIDFDVVAGADFDGAYALYGIGTPL